MIDKFARLKFSLLQITFWLSFGSFTSYYVAYMNSKGILASEIGIILASYTLCAILGQIFWGYLSDKLKTNRNIFIIANILMLGIYFVVFFTTGSLIGGFAYGLLGFIQTPIICNLDTWILKYYHKTPEEYGPIRSWASFIFAFFMLVYGNILYSKGYYIMLIFSLFFIILSVSTAFITPDIPKNLIYESKSSLNSGGINNLIKNRFFMFLLLALFLLGFASTPVMQMLPLILNNIGGNVIHQGYGMFASSIAQVPFMMFSKKLSFFSAYKRLFISSLLYLFSILLMAFAKSPAFIILMCAVNGAGFGIQLPAMRQLVFENSSDEYHNLAQGISDSVNVSLAGMVSSIFAGVVIDTYSVLHMLILNSSVQTIVIGLLVYNNKKVISKNRKDKKEFSKIGEI